jgi:hypothetical protein
MRDFKWISWNIRKVEDHGLTVEEVESAFDEVLTQQQRPDGVFTMWGLTDTGREVCVVWRYDLEEDYPDIMGDVGDFPIFVITAYEPTSV